MTFLATETLLLDHCFKEFAYVTLLRDPISRLTSQATRSSISPNARIRDLLERPSVFNTSTSSSLMGTAALDNYLTRLLLGPSAFFLPVRGINATHFAIASRVLSAFDLAIPIERLEREGAALLRARFGWRGAPVRSNSHRHALQRKVGRNGRRLGIGASASASGLGERTVRTLRTLNQWDIKLVEEARARFELQWQALQQQLGREGNGEGKIVWPNWRLKACPTDKPPQCPLTGRPTWHLGTV